ncbi:MAG: short-chain dehydrogenase [Acidobacteriota bacterium]
MEIKGKTVLVFGGAGLVGAAVCRMLMKEEPGELIVCSLFEDEVKETITEMKSKFPGSKTRMSGVSGNIFVRASLKDKTREEILYNQQYRRFMISDVLEKMDEALLKRSYLYRILRRFKPDIIVDCINTATALAYQDIYRSAAEVLKASDRVKSGEDDDFRSSIERHLCTLDTPQLVRHIQILYESMKSAGTKVYIKIGTSGTGGMGLNIPYTHSEEKPSRVLLSKSVMAGAHTMLLFLMARTPDAPITKEIKPTAAIAWKSVAYGPILKKGTTIPLYDCPPSKGIYLMKNGSLHVAAEFERLRKNDILRSVYIDTGENGFFSRGEFETITALGQMEFVTPEDIARNTILEIKGINSGHDVINALDNATMGPTYRAGSLRERAIKQMLELEKKYKKESVAFEILGPPRLSKLLYEAFLIKKVYRTLDRAAETSPSEISRNVTTIIERDRTLRAEIISIGIPILMPDGRRLLRGPSIKIPTPFDEGKPTVRNINRWAYDGWVDLRVQNMKKWNSRFKKIQEEIRKINSSETGSHYDRDRDFWLKEKEINIGKLISWIFITEEHGSRMKV